MYTEFYGLSRKPFEINPDPQFLYLTLDYQAALDATINGIESRSGFVSVTGEVGTGKTMLIHSVFTRLDHTVKTAFIFHASMPFPDLIRRILQELNVTPAGKNKEALLAQLGDYLLNRLAEDERAAVFIDEAQDLSKEAAEELGKFQEATSSISKRLQIIFVGQPEFEDRLSHGDLMRFSQKIGTRCKINVLTEKESRDYMDYRLRLAGNSVSRLFTPDAISMVVHHAKGIPRVINTLCDDAFMIGYSLSRKQVDGDIIHRVIREIEGPVPNKSVSFDIVSLLRGFHGRRISLIVLSLLCLVGFIVLIHGPLKQKPAKMWSIESIKKQPIDNTETASASRSPESKESVIGEVGEVIEVIAVRKGQTLSGLAQKYYRRSNLTLIDLILDFNPKITNVDIIEINQTIKIPKITKEWLINEAGKETFKICVGTFWSPHLAETYKNEPALKGKKVEILPRKVSPTETWYRIWFRDFATKEEALEVIDHLKKKKLLPIFGDVPD